MDPRALWFLVAALLGVVAALVVTPVAGVVIGVVAFVAMLPLLRPGTPREED